MLLLENLVNRLEASCKLSDVFEKHPSKNDQFKLLN